MNNYNKKLEQEMGLGEGGVHTYMWMHTQV